MAQVQWAHTFTSSLAAAWKADTLRCGLRIDGQPNGSLFGGSGTEEVKRQRYSGRQPSQKRSRGSARPASDSTKLSASKRTTFLTGSASCDFRRRVNPSNLFDFGLVRSPQSIARRALAVHNRWAHTFRWRKRKGGALTPPRKREYNASYNSR